MGLRDGVTYGNIGGESEVTFKSEKFLSSVVHSVNPLDVMAELFAKEAFELELLSEEVIIEDEALQLV